MEFGDYCDHMSECNLLGNEGVEDVIIAPTYSNDPTLPGSPKFDINELMDPQPKLTQTNDHTTYLGEGDLLKASDLFNTDSACVGSNNKTIKVKPTNLAETLVNVENDSKPDATSVNEMAFLISQNNIEPSKNWV
jgi:hypothetical protein